MVRPVDIAGRYNNTRGRGPYEGSGHVRPHAPPIDNPRKLQGGGNDALLKYLRLEKEMERKLPPRGIAPYTPAPLGAPPELTGQEPPKWGDSGPPPPPTVMAPRPMPRPVGPRLNPFVNPGTGLEPKGWYPGRDFNMPLSPQELNDMMPPAKYEEAGLTSPKHTYLPTPLEPPPPSPDQLWGSSRGAGPDSTEYDMRAYQKSRRPSEQINFDPTEIEAVIRALLARGQQGI